MTNRPDNTRYGRAHRALRARWAPAVATGRVTCAREGCGRLIAPNEEWDLGHVPGGGPRDYRGPEHAACNRGQPGKRWDPPAAPVTRW